MSAGDDGKPSLFDLFLNSASGFASDLEDEGEKKTKDELAPGYSASSTRASILPPPRPSADVGSIAETSSRRLFYTGAMTAYERHQRYINDYVLYYGRGKLPAVPQKPSKSDDDILKQQYRFIRTEEDDKAEDSREAWEKRLARRYYERLYREYCIADLTRYREGQVGMRWRVEKEVVIGKGQFICGSKHCEVKEGLKSYEVNFQYVEADEKKNALVKLRLCPDCAHKLNYRKEKQKRREEKKRKRQAEKEEKKMRKKMKKEGREDELAEMEERKAREAKEEEERVMAEKEEKDRAEKEAEKGKNVWKKEAQVEQTKNRSEEFEDYFRGLFP